MTEPCLDLAVLCERRNTAEAGRGGVSTIALPELSS